MPKIDTCLYSYIFYVFYIFYRLKVKKMKKKYVETRLPEEWKSCGVTGFLFSSKTGEFDDVIHMIRVAFAHVYNFNRAEAALWFGRTYKISTIRTSFAQFERF